ncbi:FAD-dependent oxidoreductase [Streptomyces albogriseolus]|uniref:protoporphyrinogen/coproporphyrinogen oxidase n=1 Tax=Streptomyces albogriseolus TaxID=1887 RepID=UPI003460F129
MDELKRLGHPAWTLLEAAPVPGGLGSSVVDPAGFTCDLGGHVIFSHFGEFDRLLAELFTAGELLHHDRSSYIRFRARWVPCPFQQHLHHLPAEDAEACVHDLLLACRRREQQLPADADFATWLQGMYGSGLVERFSGPYNAKVWAMTPEQMASTWVAERVAPADAGEVLAALEGAARPARRWGPNATFAFPARGGTGEIWRRLAARLDARLRTGARVVAVDPAARTVTLAGGEHIGFDHLVATGTAGQARRHHRRRPRHRAGGCGTPWCHGRRTSGSSSPARPCASCATSVWSPSRRPRPDRLPGDSETPERVAGQAPDSVPAQTLRCRRCRRTAVPARQG